MVAPIAKSWLHPIPSTAIRYVPGPPVTSAVQTSDAVKSFLLRSSPRFFHNLTVPASRFAPDPASTRKTFAPSNAA